MKYTVAQEISGKYKVVDENGETYLNETGYKYQERAQMVCDEMNSEPKPETPEQEHALALMGIPTTKSLKNIDAKIAAIKRAEEIENGENQ